MENRVIQHTFLKFEQNQKTQIFNDNPRQNRKNRSSEKQTSSGNTDQKHPLQPMKQIRNVCNGGFP